MRRSAKFRVGQRVQSASDPTHTFVIDKSLIPERIYHEKGSDRWWTRNELQPFGAPENPATSFRLNGKGKMRANAHNASQGNPGGLELVSVAVRGIERRKCPECGVRFQPVRPWQKFDREVCRRANWKRTRSAARRAVHCGLSAGFGSVVGTIESSTPA